MHPRSRPSRRLRAGWDARPLAASRWPEETPSAFLPQLIRVSALVALAPRLTREAGSAKISFHNRPYGRSTTKSRLVKPELFATGPAGQSGWSPGRPYG